MISPARHGNWPAGLMGFKTGDDDAPFRSGHGLAAGDLDMDGKADVVVAQTDNPRLRVYTKRTIGPWDDVVAEEFHTEYLRSFLLRAYPVDDLDLLGPANGATLAYYTSDGTPDSTELNGRLRKMQCQANEHKSGQEVIYYGMVSDEDNFMRGASKDPGQPASGPVGIFYGSFKWDTDGSYGDWYGAHEIGHSLDRPHAPYCNADPADDAPDEFPPDFAYDNGSSDGVAAYIGGPEENRLRFYGFDIGDADLTLSDGSTGLPMRVYAGDKWTDLMSYCDNQWISIHNFHKIYEKLNEIYAAATPPPGDYLVVYGYVDITAGEGEVYGVYMLKDPSEVPDPSPNSPLLLILKNESGATIATHPIALHGDSDPEPGAHEVAGFETMAPFPPDLHMLSVVYNQTEIFSRTVSANKPTVTLLTPNGGEMLGASVDEEIVVEWQGQDADGDELTYSLLYSSDNGATYEALVADWPEQRLVVSTSELRGTTQGRFLVLVEDGVHQGEDASDGAFTVAPKPLLASIQAPANGAVYLIGQNILLRGAPLRPMVK